MARFIVYPADNEAIAVAGHRRTSVSLVFVPSGALASVTLALRAASATFRKRGAHRRWWVLASLVLIVALMVGEATACPMCKAALGSHDGSHGDLVGGFFWSILFMLSMPFLIFGSLSTYMYLLVRRARRAEAQRKTAVAAVETFDDGTVDGRLREPVGSEGR